MSINHLPEFDIAKQLKNEEDIVEYLAQASEEGDDPELSYAKRVVARARSMITEARFHDRPPLGEEM